MMSKLAHGTVGVTMETHALCYFFLYGVALHAYESFSGILWLYSQLRFAITILALGP
jgi:hypothetical protein